MMEKTKQKNISLWIFIFISCTLFHIIVCIIFIILVIELIPYLNI